MPALKKDPSIRRRKNRAATAATLIRAEPEAGSASEQFAGLTVAQLRAQIVGLNESRPAEARISPRGRKEELIAALVAASSPVPAMPPPPGRYDPETGETRQSDWHPQTVAWWAAIWTSPMAAQWDSSDVHNVSVLALLYDDIWTARGAKGRREALTEYRQQRADLGLSPYARRRLEWSIETAEEAKARGARRRSTVGPERPEHPPTTDPRLHLVGGGQHT